MNNSSNAQHVVSWSVPGGERSGVRDLLLSRVQAVAEAERAGRDRAGIKPDGGCIETAEQLWFALDLLSPHCQPGYVDGTVHGHFHRWLRILGGIVIVDITGDQFNAGAARAGHPPMPAVYVGPQPEWYRDGKLL